MIREHAAVKLREAAEQVARKKQREVKDLVTMQLRRRSLPKMQLIEAIWDLLPTRCGCTPHPRPPWSASKSLFNESFEVSAQADAEDDQTGEPEPDGLNHRVAVDFHRRADRWPRGGWIMSANNPITGLAANI